MKYTITSDNGETTEVDTCKAAYQWDQRWVSNGENLVGAITGDRWLHETLYLHADGRYYLRAWSERKVKDTSVRWLSNYDAEAWKRKNKAAVNVSAVIVG